MADNLNGPFIATRSPSDVVAQLIGAVADATIDALANKPADAGKE